MSQIGLWVLNLCFEFLISVFFFNAALEADKHAKKKKKVHGHRSTRLLNLWQWLASPSLDMLPFKLVSLRMAHLWHSCLETISSDMSTSSALLRDRVNDQMG